MDLLHIRIFRWFLWPKITYLRSYLCKNNLLIQEFLFQNFKKNLIKDYFVHSLKKAIYRFFIVCKFD
jgi:hypothetical protein